MDLRYYDSSSKSVVACGILRVRAQSLNEQVSGHSSLIIERDTGPTVYVSLLRSLSPCLSLLYEFCVHGFDLWYDQGLDLYCWFTLRDST